MKKISLAKHAFHQQDGGLEPKDTFIEWSEHLFKRDLHVYT